MFERFDPDARAAVLHARDEAARSGRRAIGTEHLLLGLLSRPGHASDALTAAGADAMDLREQIVPADADATPAGSAAGGTPDTVDELPMTNHARHALELALQAAQRLRHRNVTSGHLLLGIIDQPHNGGVQALRVARIHVGTLRVDVLQRMTTGAESDTPVT
jgi:ATP-dependent Clp protease ATP-binding subunit ClpA